MSVQPNLKKTELENSVKNNFIWQIKQHNLYWLQYNQPVQYNKIRQNKAGYRFFPTEEMEGEVPRPLADYLLSPHQESSSQ